MASLSCWWICWLFRCFVIFILVVLPVLLPSHWCWWLDVDGGGGCFVFAAGSFGGSTSGVIVSSSSSERLGCKASNSSEADTLAVVSPANSSIPNSFFDNPDSIKRSTKSDLLPDVGRSFRIHKALSLAAVRLDFNSSDNLFTSLALSFHPFNHLVYCFKNNLLLEVVGIYDSYGMY